MDHTVKTRDILTYHYIEIRYFIIILGVFSDEEKGHAWQAFVTYNPGNRKPPRIIGHKP